MHRSSRFKPSVAVILPTYCERANILQVLRAVRRALRRGGALIVVDDASPDGTASLVHAVATFDRNLFLVNNPHKAGRGAAVMTGFRWAVENLDPDVLVEMDADSSHQAAELPALIAVAAQNKVAVASRYLPGSRIQGWPLRRHIFSRLANWVIRTVLRVPLSDATNGFRAYPRAAIDRLIKQPLSCRSFMVLSEVALVLSDKRYAFRELPSLFINRTVGVSNTNWKEIAANLRELLQLYIRFR
jgi:dolichol-phosphate mannosyltransferase